MRPGPDHYTSLKPEPIDVIHAWRLNYNIGNVVKYVARYPRKGGVEDLKKARQYLDWEIAALESLVEPDTFVTTTPLGHGLVAVDVWERHRVAPPSERPEPVPPQDGE